MIGIIDYGLGNVHAFANVYRGLGIPATLVRTSSELDRVSHVIIPGVGAFDHAMECLERSGMRQKLDEVVLEQQRPVLGVCVGMQMLTQASEEGTRPGLGWIDGEAKRFAPSSVGNALAVPHMGWNDVRPKGAHPLFRGLSDQQPRFYFLHSYYVTCRHESSVIANTDYGHGFACAVNQGNIVGVQFHPEKSHRFGIQLLRNFGELSA